MFDACVGGTEVVMTHSGFPDAGMRDFLAGSAVSIPDLLLALILGYVEQMPGGKALPA